MHECVVTGLKVGAGREFYARLAHDPKLFARVVEFVMTAFVKAFMMITLSAVGVKRTKDCFTKMWYRYCDPNTKMRYRYRDPNLDLWLHLKQEARASGKATVWQLLKGLTFIEMVQNLLKTSETNRKKLSKLLIEGNHTFTLPEIEALIERQEAGENIGLFVNGYANFLFTEGSDGNVFVVCAYRDGRQWRVGLLRLGFVNRWSAGLRLFSRLPAIKAGN